jgi:hypothetical protein
MGRCWGTIGLGQMANRWFGARAAFVKLWRVEGGDRALAGKEGRSIALFWVAVTIGRCVGTNRPECVDADGV